MRFLLIVSAWLCALSVGAGYQREHIQEATIAIAIDKLGALSITENLCFVHTGETIKRGFIREIPTRYQDWWRVVEVPFSVKEARIDTMPARYRVVSRANGHDVYLYGGTQEDPYIVPGDHCFSLTYSLDRQIGFFDDHDELYFNIIGTGMPFYIKKVTARLYMPPGVNAEDVNVLLFTGAYGDQRNDARIEQRSATFIDVVTTKSLAPYEGFTIALALPKGIIPSPSLVQRTGWFLYDNGATCLLFLFFILLLTLYAVHLVRLRRANKGGVIFPLFEAPEGISPALARFIMRTTYDTVALTAALVHLAVKGFLTISYDTQTRIYTLINNKQHDNNEKTGLSLDEYELWRELFVCTSSIECRPHEKKMRTVAHAFSSAISSLGIPHYFSPDRFLLYITGASGVLVIAGSLFLRLFYGYTPTILDVVLIAAIILVHCFVFSWLVRYTAQGVRIKTDLEGFKLFLGTTERERYARMTDVTLTPERYETLLPYAIAFGVEKQWAARFEPLFKELEKQGKPYTPHWYYGRFNPVYFGSTLGSSLTSSIAAAQRSPGSSSGFGGSGFSGGGSGGGGGRGF